MIFKDKAGKELQPGDLIVYGHTVGDSCGLRYGKVIAVKQSCDAYTNKPRTKLQIHGADDDWSHREPSLLSKKSTLEFGERVLCIAREQVPEGILKLLDGVGVKPEHYDVATALEIAMEYIMDRCNKRDQEAMDCMTAIDKELGIDWHAIVPAE